ncbi:MAG: hypothetical protein U0Z44_04325 [Kouleothrix sp.]
MALPFEPACLPLLLGGLPHRSPAQALEISRRYAGALLAWPQLPQRSFREQSFVQSMLGFPGLVIDASKARVYVDRRRAERELDRLGLAYLEDRYTYGALDGEDAPGLDELVRQGDALHGSLALKGQLMGPISLATQLTDEHDQPLMYDDMLFDALVQHLSLRAEWQEARLSELNPATIICLDEPFLEMVGLPFVPIDWERARQQIDQTLEGVHGCKALYAGGAVSWPEILQTSIDMVIADVYQHSQALLAAAPDLAALIERDGIVGLGIVPTDEELVMQTRADQVVALVVALAEQFEQHGIARDRLLQQAVISTAGTLGRLSVAAAERAIQLVADTSRLLREQYGLG